MVPGITFTGNWVNLLVGGAIFGLFNLIVRPIATFLSLPLLILTLGLFYFVLNGILLWVAAQFIPGYDVSGLVAGILGSIVITVVNWLVGAIFGGSRPFRPTDATETRRHGECRERKGSALCGSVRVSYRGAEVAALRRSDRDVERAQQGSEGCRLEALVDLPQALGR